MPPKSAKKRAAEGNCYKARDAKAEKKSTIVIKESMETIDPYDKIDTSECMDALFFYRNDIEEDDDEEEDGWLPENINTILDYTSNYIRQEEGFMSANIDGTEKKSYLFFKAGVNRDGWRSIYC
jgi:hypothetical protein